MSQKLGIIGGSFDPIHNGHLVIALDALEQFSLDQVVFVPAYRAPLRAKGPIASAKQRMKMVELAIADEPRFRTSDIDYRAESVSYSFRTARLLAEENPSADLRWILGADQVAQLHQWRKIESLAADVSFIAFDRPGSEIANPELPACVRIRHGRPRSLEISSTEIRERLKSGRPAKYFLPGEVFAYIKAENLYL